MRPEAQARAWPSGATDAARSTKGSPGRKPGVLPFCLQGLPACTESQPAAGTDMSLRRATAGCWLRGNLGARKTDTATTRQPGCVTPPKIPTVSPRSPMSIARASPSGTHHEDVPVLRYCCHRADVRASLALRRTVKRWLPQTVPAAATPPATEPRDDPSGTGRMCSGGVTGHSSRSDEDRQIQGVRRRSGRVNDPLDGLVGVATVLLPTMIILERGRPINSVRDRRDRLHRRTTGPSSC